MKSRETETFSRPDILGLTGTETSTETRKVSVPRVSVPRVSAPRPPISGMVWYGLVGYGSSYKGMVSRNKENKMIIKFTE